MNKLQERKIRKMIKRNGGRSIGYSKSEKSLYIFTNGHLIWGLEDGGDFEQVNDADLITLMGYDRGTFKHLPLPKEKLQKIRDFVKSVVHNIKLKDRRQEHFFIKYEGCCINAEYFIDSIDVLKPDTVMYIPLDSMHKGYRNIVFIKNNEIVGLQAGLSVDDYTEIG